MPIPISISSSARSKLGLPADGTVQAFTAIPMEDVKHVMINCINQLLVYTKLPKSFGNDLTADFNTYEATWITEKDSGETGLLFDKERGFYIIPLEEKAEVVEEVKDIIIRQARIYNGYV